MPNPPDEPDPSLCIDFVGIVYGMYIVGIAASVKRGYRASEHNRVTATRWTKDLAGLTGLSIVAMFTFKHSAAMDSS